MDWNLILFIIAFSAGAICTIAVIIDLLFPSFNVWPHAEGDLVGLIISLFLWGSFYFATLALWVSILPQLHGVTTLTWLGLFLFLGGTVFLIWSMVVLKIHVSLGVKREFITHGPYNLCRNPQTTGLIVQLIGAVLISLSNFMIILAALHVLLLILAIIKEERWLTEQYGEVYGAYKKSTPNRLVPDIGKLFFKAR